jgi:hypothetical protein
LNAWVDQARMVIEGSTFKAVRHRDRHCGEDRSVPAADVAQRPALGLRLVRMGLLPRGLPRDMPESGRWLQGGARSPDPSVRGGVRGSMRCQPLKPPITDAARVRRMHGSDFPKKPSGRIYCFLRTAQPTLYGGFPAREAEQAAPRWSDVTLALQATAAPPACGPQTDPVPPERSSPMRNYPRNSPEAAARIVALVLVSDGHVCSSEFDVLRRMGAEHELGLDPGALPHIVHTLCEELLMSGCVTGSLLAHVDDAILASLMAEVKDPTLQAKVVRLALAAARADGHLADGEAMVLAAARRHWQLAEGDEADGPEPARTATL